MRAQKGQKMQSLAQVEKGDLEIGFPLQLRWIGSMGKYCYSLGKNLKLQTSNPGKK